MKTIFKVIRRHFSTHKGKYIVAGIVLGAALEKLYEYVNFEDAIEKD